MTPMQFFRWNIVTNVLMALSINTAATILAGGDTLAGIVTYATHTVLRCQYIASTERGRELSALALLSARLRQDAVASGRRWLDFGTSNRDHGRYLNEGLVQQKSRLGGRGIVFNTYQLDL